MLDISVDTVNMHPWKCIAKGIESFPGLLLCDYAEVWG